MDSIAIASPVGAITIFAENENIVALSWGIGLDAPKTSPSSVLTQAVALLLTYFKTGQDEFSTLAIKPKGTAFQKSVWQEMCKIKPGHTKSYGDVAKTLKSGPRAVGGACGANPIPILIPCHRIITGTGKIGHYSGGLGQSTKEILLRLEGAIT